MDPIRKKNKSRVGKPVFNLQLLERRRNGDFESFMRKSLQQRLFSEKKTL